LSAALSAIDERVRTLTSPKPLLGQARTTPAAVRSNAISANWPCGICPPEAMLSVQGPAAMAASLERP
jgi:hypothetical protein